MTVVNSEASQRAVVEAALVVLERMGLSPADLTAVPQTLKPVPIFAEYVPVVSAAVSDGTRRAYGSYWNRVVEQWGGRRLDEPTPSEIRQLMTYVKTHVVARRNARGGRSAEEHLVAALRCLYQRAVDDGLIAEADNPARKVAKPRRLPSTRRAAPVSTRDHPHAAAVSTDNRGHAATVRTGDRSPAAGASMPAATLVRVPQPDYARPGSVAASFFTAWASIDTIHDGPDAYLAHCADLVTPALRRQLAASQPALTGWQALRAERMISLVHVRVVTRPVGAPPRGAARIYLRVYAQRVTTTTAGRAVTSDGITLLLVRRGHRWLVSRLLWY
jgi:hypothetical protein